MWKTLRKTRILKLFLKQIPDRKFYFLQLCFLYIKMLRGYYQKLKESFQKRIAKGTKLSEEKKKRSANMVLNDAKVF